MAGPHPSVIARDRPTSPGRPDAPPGWLFVPPVLVGLVLRWWALGANGLSADEMFTGAHAAEPWTTVITRVADDDTHGPLDFLVRNPLAGLHDPFALRVPSAVFASATLLLVWWWARRKGWLGFWFVTLTALSSFELLYARTAQPFALLVLCGTVVAFAADSWWRGDRATRWAVVGAVAAAVALLADSTGGLLVVGGLILPGLARDRASWIWRAAMAAAGAAYLAAWGWVSLHQYQSNALGHIPLADPAYAIREVGRLGAVFYPDNGFVLVPLVVVGAVLLRSLDRKLAWVLASVSLVPLAVAVTAAFRFHFLFARSLSSVAWGIPLALAALLEWARRRGVVYGLLAALALVVLLLPSISPVLSYDEQVQATGDQLRALARPGDAVAVDPAFLSHIAEWSLGTPRRSSPIPGWQPDATYTTILPGAPFTGRVIALDVQGYPSPALAPCPDVAPRTFGDIYTVTCYRLSA